MRIASLVPSATEMLFELGAGDDVVAVTHECDWPAQASELPHLTRSVIPSGLDEREIDAAVRELTGAGKALYELDRGRLEKLDVDLIFTQAVCEVCAVSYDDVADVAAALPTKPDVISLDPLTFEDVLADITRAGEVIGAGGAARALRERSQRRLQNVANAIEGEREPRVLALEWLDPPFVGGHWVPEMIALAGGVDVIGERGEKSRTVEWEELESLPCDVAIVMPCGYDAQRASEEAHSYRDRLESLSAKCVVAVDAAAYFSRPGPRLVEGVELLAHILHPDRVASPGAQRFNLAF